MRLRLFDRIRRLVHPRRSRATGTVPQGRHRRDQRHAPGYGPSAVPAEPSLAGPVTRPADIAPDEWPAPQSSFAPSAQPGPAHRATGSPAVRVGGARARIREAPGEPDARSAPGLPPDRYQTRPPADRADARSEALARAAAGIPLGAKVWRELTEVATALDVPVPAPLG